MSGKDRAGGRGGGLGARPKSKTRATPAALSKPLLPVSERKSQEDNAPYLRVKKGSDEKWDITPDGGSAGREGRQFTVANVGNNGRIYLRYVVVYLAPGELGGDQAGSALSAS